MKTLFSGQTEDGNSATFRWDGGFGTFMAWGTWGSGTITLYASPDGGSTWISLGSSYALTGDGVVNLSLAPCSIRAVLSGSSGADLNCQIRC